MRDEPLNNAWHLDRRVTVSLILALLGNACATVWWASTISSTVSDLRLTDARHDVLLQTLSTGRETNSNRITSLEAKEFSIETKLGRIEDKLDRLIEHQIK